MNTADKGSLSRYRWFIVGLLFLATANNYVNRITLSVVIPEVKRDLAIDDIQYSYVLSVFQFAYMFGMLAAGKFIDRIGTKLGYLALMTAWSLSATLHAAAGSAFSLGAWRTILGVSEAGNFPAAVKSVSEWFPIRERAFATSLFNSGPHVAMVAGPPLIAFMTLAAGWRTTFLVIGLSGFLLVAAWPFFYREPPENDVSSREKGTETSNPWTWRKLLGYRDTYGIMLGKFFTDPVWWFYIFWLPNYLNTQRGLDIKAIGFAIPLIYLVAIMLGIAGGWLPGFLMRRGWPVSKARKTAMLVSALCLPVTALAVVAQQVWLTIALVGLACGAHSGWSNNIFTLVSDRFPSKAVGSVTGLGGFAGAVGGFLISTFAVGYIVTYVGYVPIFILMGVLHPLAMLCVHCFVRGEPVATER